MGPGWPFVARAADLDAAARALGPRTGARGLVITGPAGIGKTRLARELLARSGTRDTTTRWLVGTATARHVPFGAFGTLLGPSVGDTPDLLEHAAHQLLRGTDDRSVVVVDDAHLLDELSALLVHHLVLHTEATVLLTVRTGEPSADALSTLWRDDTYPGRARGPRSMPSAGGTPPTGLTHLRRPSGSAAAASRSRVPPGWRSTVTPAPSTWSAAWPAPGCR